MSRIAYQVGNRTIVTETIRQPGFLAGVTAFLEQNGQLVVEAESGITTAGLTHSWNSQTAQSDYAGIAYLRALPDIGQQYDASATDSPRLDFTIQIDNPGSYTVWARGMASDAGGDSLHVGLNGGTPSTAANLTGFTPNAWSWSRLTMSNTNATLDLSSGGTYTLNVSMREDGLRLDRLMLVTDTNTIPTGQGPLESPTTTALPPLGDQFITYVYDPLYRLTEAAYTGTFSGTYQYEYDAVGNRDTYTTTITTTTEVATYQYDAANRLTQSLIQGGDTTTYDWDNASRLITTTVASAVSRVYGYSQDGDLLSALVDGQTTTFLYDGNGNRLQMAVGSEVTTYTLDYGRGFQLLMEQGGAFATIKHYLYGLECIGELIDADIPASKEWRYYQRDGNSLVRQTTNEQEDITLAWTFSPEGAVVLGEEGSVTTLDCGNNAVYDWSTGLLFKNGRYFDPRTAIWITLAGMIVWQMPQLNRKDKRSRKRQLLLFLLFILVLLTMVGCSTGTANLCGTPKTRAPLPTSPAYDAAIKSSTVIVEYEAPTIKSLGLGTVVDGGTVIITHNHFDAMAEQNATNFNVNDSSGALIKAFAIADIRKSYVNAQIQKITLPQALPSPITSSKIGSPCCLIIGDGVSVAYKDGATNRVEVLHTQVALIGFPSAPNIPQGSSVLSAFFDNSTGIINAGDSGGGLFLEGKLIGNNWQEIGRNGNPEFTSALLLP